MDAAPDLLLRGVRVVQVAVLVCTPSSLLQETLDRLGPGWEEETEAEPARTRLARLGFT